MNGTLRSTGKAEMISILFGTEDVTISVSLPPSLVTLCHQNLPILATSLPPPSGDVIFEWPLKRCQNAGTIQIAEKEDVYLIKR